MHTWHTQECDLKFRYEDKGKHPVRAFWCNTHNQWAYEFPVTVNPVYAPHFTDSLIK